MDEPLYETNLRREQETKKWDVFRDPPRKVESGSMVETKWIDFGEKCGKVAAYIITFCVVLGCAIISKGTLLFMTSQINPEEKPYCNDKLDKNKQFTVTLPQEERVAWIWMLVFTFCAPQIGIFIRSLRKLLFKSWETPDMPEFVGVFISESFSTIGSAMLVFVILPKLDVVKGIMLTNAFCFVPAVLGLLSYFDWKAIFGSRNDDDDDEDNISVNETPKRDLYMSLKVILDLLCIAAQVTVFFLWPSVKNDVSLWCIPACAILISCSWWENYISEDSKIGFLRRQAAKKRKFEMSRYYIYVFVSLWKCLLFFMSMIMIFWIENSSVSFLFDDFEIAFSSHPIKITEVTPIIITNVDDIVTEGTGTTIDNNYLTPVWVFLINVLSSYMCYGFGKFACKVYIQSVSYAFPINLAVPVTISALIAMCGMYNVDECTYYDTIPPYLFFNTPSMLYVSEFIGEQQSWIWLLWLISQAWITVHIWTPTCEKLSSTERLYMRPMFEPFLVEQDMALNRRRDHKPLRRQEEEEYDDDDDDDLIQSINSNEHKSVNESDLITRIYACGTMWHETKDEMMEFLKSIIRLDEDQSARRIVKEYLQFNIPDYYEIETHIFFDDAFVRLHKDDPDPQINEYVKELVEAVDDAASEVHETRIRVRPPKKFVTPYGGRLMWTLPGKTKMIAHLKDPKKIRKKKRWSQVMYMYYLLGHKLVERDDLSIKRKEIRAENTYILALDGDIDFQPKAVHLLVDLMKKNKTLGAACGRIHPIGSGIMVWYQMFEYAIGHWLQKSTEHVIGCVLCSPGCFSLFRGKALMDDSVMKKYTTKSSEARHYVQYDQGEDRWLCTLLLQRGYRVEYAAASDAYTHCPEGFNEFYNQRRRWMPSTTANILDLLMNSKATMKANDNISKFYILYQLVLMLGTILGAGTIFLMLVGAFSVALQLDQWSSFVWNIVPIGVFILTCALFSNDKIQLFVAAVLSGLYSLIMMAVLVGVILQIKADGFLAPSSLFFFFVAMEMIIAGLMHPKELNCLPFGVVYYVTVPSMYLLLVIYSVFNMNNVSWGTREVTVVAKPNPSEAVEEPKSPQEKPKPQNKIISFFGGKEEDNKGAFEFSMANMFKCMLCTHRDKTENEELEKINSRLDKLMQKLDNFEKMGDPSMEEMPVRRRTTMVSGLKMEPHVNFTTNNTPSITESVVSEEVVENTWLEDKVLQRGEVDFITGKEYDFWNGLLDKYLHPIDDNDVRIKRNLKDLRDKSVMAFFMINALFVLVIFLLTLKKETIHLNWPFGAKANFTYNDDVSEVVIYKEYLQLEPIGIVFVFAFGVLLIVQFIAMFIHRFETFSQIISNTTISLNILKMKTEDLSAEEILEMDAVDTAKKLQKLKGVDNDDEDENKMEAQPGRRKTIHNLTKSGRKQFEATSDLERAFQRRLGKYQNKSYNGPVRRDTIMALDSRKSRIMRASQAHIVRPNFVPDGQTNLGFVGDEITV